MSGPEISDRDAIGEEHAGRPLLKLMYAPRLYVPPDELRQDATDWLSAMHIFATDALGSGSPPSEVIPAVVQMLEGWMLAHDPQGLAGTWSALDAVITLLHHRLAQVTEERDNFRESQQGLLDELDKARRRNRRSNRTGKKH